MDSPEELDAFLERHKDSGIPNTILRMAWAVNEPPEKVWDEYLDWVEERRKDSI